MNPLALKALIRSRLLSGDLPSGTEHHLVIRKKAGGHCCCCHQPIGREQAQYNVVVAAVYGDPASFAMHVACYSGWLSECNGSTALAV
jgi:hypothetical protein